MSEDGRPRPGRPLRPAERALWQSVTRDVSTSTRRFAGGSSDLVAPTSAVDASAPPASRPPAGVATPRLPPLAPLERRLRQRLTRGQVGADASLDLHGLRQDEAFTALVSFLSRQQRRGARVVLVVTGKGGRGGEPGVLRRAVPLWLAAAPVRGLVIGFEEAGAQHGGSGALYVRLRRGADRPEPPD